MLRLRSAFASILLSFLPSISHAAPCQPQFEGAFWAEKDLRIVGLDAAYSACPSWFSGVRVGASYFADGTKRVSIELTSHPRNVAGTKPHKTKRVSIELSFREELNGSASN